MAKGRALITGGAGFIGTSLVKALLGRGYTITVMDNFSEQVHGNNKSLHPDLERKIDVFTGTVTDESEFKEALQGQDYVVHLAAETGTGQSMYRIGHYTSTNIYGTSVLCDFLVNGRHKIKKVVVASSRAIYGEGKYLCGTCGTVYPSSRPEHLLKQRIFEPPCPVCGRIEKMTAVPTTEDAAIHPSSIYGLTKQVQEHMVLMTAASVGIDAFALRYQNVFGPGQSLSNPYSGILAIFSTMARNNLDINIFEDGDESRDFVYIDDAIEATVRCLESDLKGQFASNVGTGRRITVTHVAEKIVRFLNSRSRIHVTGTWRKGDIRHNFADMTYGADLLGFEAKVDFDMGLRAFLDWMLKQENVPIGERYAKSLKEMKQKGLYS